jgi:hypothetical protein
MRWSSISWPVTSLEKEAKEKQSMSQLVSAAGQPVILNPKASQAKSAVEGVKPENGWLLVKTRKLSDLIELSQDAKGNTANFDWRFDVIAAASKYFSSQQGKWLNTPFKAGDVVCLVAGSWQSYPFPEWNEEGFAMVHWEMVIGSVNEKQAKEADGNDTDQTDES